MANYVKPVVFLLGKEMYGVDINLVQSIEKDLNVVPVPNSQSYIKRNCQHEKMKSFRYTALQENLEKSRKQQQKYDHH